MQRTDSLEKTLIMGKTEGRRRRGWQRMRWLDGIIDSMDMSLSKLLVIVKDREAACAVAHSVPKSQTHLSNWITSGCIRIQSLVTIAMERQHIPKGGQGGNQEWSTLCSGKTGRTSLQIDTFRFYEPKSLHFLLSRKALKSFITTSTLTIEERNAFWSTNGVAVLKAVSAGESKQDPVGTSARFMINLLLWTFTPFLVQNLFSSRLRSSKEKETRCTVGRKGSWVDKIIDVYCGILLIVHCWITEGEEGEWSFL